jgi:hypothetical protein
VEQQRRGERGGGSEFEEMAAIQFVLHIVAEYSPRSAPRQSLSCPASDLTGVATGLRQCRHLP